MICNEKQFCNKRYINMYKYVCRERANAWCESQSERERKIFPTPLYLNNDFINEAHAISNIKRNADNFCGYAKRDQSV